MGRLPPQRQQLREQGRLRAPLQVSERGGWGAVPPAKGWAGTVSSVGEYIEHLRGAARRSAAACTHASRLPARRASGLAHAALPAALCRVPVCELPPAVGSGDVACMAYIPRYAWNSKTGECEEFIWGGCGGNKVGGPAGGWVASGHAGGARAGLSTGGRRDCA